jgi:hypothetical protein
VHESVRSVSTERVLAALDADPQPHVVHAWWAYVEDLALSWSAPQAAERDQTLDEVVDHCVRALRALTALA